jgi:D-arabinose 1-dehydrogenase-like Zn-dependent alcohol dehydrogenase
VGRRAVDLSIALVRVAPTLTCMRAVQITRFGGPEVLDIVDVPAPTPGPGQKLYDVSTAGLNFADTHHDLS